MMYNLFLDDIRGEPNEQGVWRNKGTVWQVVRNTKECIQFLVDHPGEVHTISFDHDLGEYDKETGKERTGYDVLCWLEEKAVTDASFDLPIKLRVHSANVAAYNRMVQAIMKITNIRKARESA